MKAKNEVSVCTKDQYNKVLIRLLIIQAPAHKLNTVPSTGAELGSELYLASSHFLPQWNKDAVLALAGRKVIQL